ncbi:MAG: signal peptidase I [Planctomycetota bacterium]|nr:MAG: signal peptidase I [Planctomycetota bacterium]
MLRRRKANADSPCPPRIPRARRALRLLERGFAVVGVMTVVYVLTLDLSVVASPSMSPTLEGTSVDNGDRVLTEKVSYWFRRPRRWEVITFTRHDGLQIMKRVAGLPGEHMRLSKARELFVDDRQVHPPEALNQKYLRFGNLFAGEPVPCGDGYYVLGDETRDSDDSRFNGPVPPEQVVGRSWLIVWPLSRFGFVR